MDQVKIAITAAAPINPDLVKFFMAIGIPLFELYGMSETTGPATTNVPDAFKIGSVGKAIPGVEVKTADDGELLMRGGVITQGYYKLDQATRETYADDGWLHSGDLARIDEDGFVWIVGRKKEIIITAAGKNVAPAQLEAALGNHPIISKACMVGDRRKFLSMVIGLDGEMAPEWAAAHGIDYNDLASFSGLPEVQEEIARAVEEANEAVSHAGHGGRRTAATYGASARAARDPTRQPGAVAANRPRACVHRAAPAGSDSPRSRSSSWTTRSPETRSRARCRRASRRMREVWGAARKPKRAA